MEKFEDKDKNLALELKQKIDKIVIQAATTDFFRDLVMKAPSRLDAMRSVREHLEEYFPEIKTLPIIKPDIIQSLSNDYKVAKVLVELLWKERVPKT